MAPQLTYDVYKQTHSRLGEEDFKVFLPAAYARLVAITGQDIEPCWHDKWLAALGALCEHIAGVDGAHTGIKSQSVGATSVTYTDAEASKSDIDVVEPWLYGTGLLYCGLA